MSEMFTKCNGFIVSGDPLVYADSATMTGQGTVSEPFGVKSTDLFVQEPLYTGTSGNSAYIGWNNETVLWSGTPDTTGYNLTLLDNLNNYDNFVVIWKSYQRVYRDGFVANSTAYPLMLGSVFVNSDGNYEKSLTTWTTTDGSTYNWKATIHGSFTGNQSNTWNANVVPLEVRGINRKV